jgi:hypothetical protein
MACDLCDDTGWVCEDHDRFTQLRKKRPAKQNNDEAVWEEKGEAKHTTLARRLAA